MMPQFPGVTPLSPIRTAVRCTCGRRDHGKPTIPSRSLTPANLWQLGALVRYYTIGFIQSISLVGLPPTVQSMVNGNPLLSFVLVLVLLLNSNLPQKQAVFSLPRLRLLLLHDS
jgi:hypothetical protein